jgi:hypothetical protein
MELGATVVREVAKASVRKLQPIAYDHARRAIRVTLPGALPFWLLPATLRRNDT